MQSTDIDETGLDPDLLPSIEPVMLADADLIGPIFDAISAAVAERDVSAAQVFAGRTYERKNEQCTTAFGDPPHEPHDRGDGDFYFQLGIRVPAHASASVLDAVRIVENRAIEQALHIKHKELDEARASTRSAQEAEARIRTEIDRLSAKR